MRDVAAAAVSDAALAACLFATDPTGLGGVLVRAPADSRRDTWLSLLRKVMAAQAPMRRVPVFVGESRLLGGLDLAASLRAGRPIAERGLLAEADGGVLVLPMAERLPPNVAAQLAAALECGLVRLERDGLSRQVPSRFGVVALDEGVDEEHTPPALGERLAFHIDLAAFEPDAGFDMAAVADARAALPHVVLDDAITAALCQAAMQLGVASLRASLFAVRASRAAAALAGRTAVTEADATLAARLVLAPRATLLPVAPQDAPSEPQPSESQPSEQPSEPRQSGDETPRQEPDAREAAATQGKLDDIVLEAAQAAIPKNLLAALMLACSARTPVRSSGRAGVLKPSSRKGRPAGSRAGTLRDGVRLNLIETLRAAAPWQVLRRGDPHGRIEVRPDDFRITRFKQRTETTTIFVVDASGSSAFNRLAEAKGAVELLLADCYQRRDQVALIAFRGRGAELILPPTRSLVRAKRGLAALPGGGGTPLAAALESATALADGVRRRGQTPIIILMTDGQANVARDGGQGRDRAMQDAVAAARRLRAAAFTALLIDTSPRARQTAGRLAQEMGADYSALPYADSRTLSNVVRAKTAARHEAR